MIELKYIENKKTKEKVLYYRVMRVAVDTSGSLCPNGGWDKWKKVLTIAD